MKRDLKRNSVFYIGKGIIIIVVLIISSLSFTLGYFVGKGIQPPVLNQAPIITRQESTEQKNIAPEKKEAVIQEPTQETQQTANIQQDRETKLAQKTKETIETKGTKENNNPPSPPFSKRGKGGFSDEVKEAKENSKTRKYTVQAGVFKDVSAADALKAKLDKKGYKTCIIPSETKRYQKLYKVMVGEFATRKEAEILSIKIKNAESLQTFVTFMTGEKEELR